eukprot:TRINITY_DN254_c0_g1_i3.p1 TRINITY_DN254_c0_g1~~TRINITY_DN254_c0_g1_i3.p1  ORF type:complete len:1352 (+),score=399.59 TRINITY_DN254_c0_g1_i3:155-4210(+)
MSTSPKDDREYGVGTLLRHFKGNDEGMEVLDSQQRLCEQAGLDCLINLTRHEHVKVKHLAMVVVSSLEEEGAEITVSGAEGVRPLVELALFNDESVQKDAVWTLAILAANGTCRERIKDEVGWHNIRKYANSSSPDVQAAVSILLGNLAIERSDRGSMIRTGFGILTEMLHKTDNVKVQRAVITALSNVSIIDEHDAHQSWITSGIPLMLQHFNSEDYHIRVGVLNSFSNLVQHTSHLPELKSAIIERAGNLFVPLLHSKDETIQKIVTMIIASLATVDSYKDSLCDQGVVKPLVKLLDSRDEEVRLGTSMSINVLADSKRLVKEFRSVHANEPLVEVILDTKDREVKREAQEALAKLAPEDVEDVKRKLASKKKRRNSAPRVQNGSESESSWVSSSSDESEYSGSSPSSRSSSDSESDSQNERSGSGSYSRSGSSDSVSSDSSSSSDSEDDEADRARAAREEEERKAREEEERVLQAQARTEEERVAREEQEWLENARAQERARLAEEEQRRKQQEEESARIAAEEEAMAAALLAVAKKDREEVERRQREEDERLQRKEDERLEREEAERLKREEVERLKREEAERLRREQEEEERRKREDAERLLREAAEAEEQRTEAERLKREEEDRLRREAEEQAAAAERAISASESHSGSSYSDSEDDSYSSRSRSRSGSYSSRSGSRSSSYSDSVSSDSDSDSSEDEISELNKHEMNNLAAAAPDAAERLRELEDEEKAILEAEAEAARVKAEAELLRLREAEERDRERDQEAQAIAAEKEALRLAEVEVERVREEKRKSLSASEFRQGSDDERLQRIETLHRAEREAQRKQREDEEFASRIEQERKKREEDERLAALAQEMAIAEAAQKAEDARREAENLQNLEQVRHKLEREQEVREEEEELAQREDEERRKREDTLRRQDRDRLRREEEARLAADVNRAKRLSDSRASQESISRHDTSSDTSADSRQHRRSRDSRHSDRRRSRDYSYSDRSSSVSSFDREDISPSQRDPETLPLRLLQLLREYPHDNPREGVTRADMTELARFAELRQRDQLRYAMDIIPLLVLILYRYPPDRYEEVDICCLYLLAILVRNHANNQLIMRRVKGGDIVIQLMSASQESVKQKATLCLGAFCLNNNPIQGEVSRAVPLLCAMLKSEAIRPLTKCTVAAAMASLADNHMSNQNAIKADGGLRDMIHLMLQGDRSGAPARVWLNLLSALVSGNPEMQIAVVQDHPRVLTYLTDLMGTSQSTMVLTFATNVCVELSKKNARVQVEMYNAGIIPLLVRAIQVPGADETIMNSLYVLGSLYKLKKPHAKIRSEYTRLKVRDQLRVLANSKNRSIKTLANTIEKNLEVS